MNSKTIILFFTIFLTPTLCLGSNGSNNGFNWAPIIGSIIIGGVFVISSLVREKSKTETKNILYKKIDTSGIKKVIKILLAAIIIFIIFNLIIIPMVTGPHFNQTYNSIISIITALIIIIAYKKINRNGKY